MSIWKTASAEILREITSWSTHVQYPEVIRPPENIVVDQNDTKLITGEVTIYTPIYSTYEAPGIYTPETQSQYLEINQEAVDPYSITPSKNKVSFIMAKDNDNRCFNIPK